MKSLILLFVVLVLVGTSCTSVEKKKAGLLKYFSELTLKKDHRVMSGQFIGWGQAASLKDVKTIYKNSGKWVGFLGADYHNLDYIRDHYVHKPISSELSVTNKNIIDYGVKFCFFSMHFNNPFTDSSAWDNRADLKILLQDEKIRTKLDQQMDSMSLGFEELQKNGIIIFLRPLHEMNGGWFWWGDKDSTDFIALWKYIYNYFTIRKNLKNIAWVYSPCLWPVKYLKWYPGDKYVDIVCVDAYTSIIHPYFDQAYKELSSLNKPLGIGEFGPCDASDWEGIKPCHFEFDKLIKEIREYYPDFIFFMTWDIHMSMAHPFHSKVKELLEDNWVINKEETEKLER